ncbi:MAG: hypothetical protein CL596_08140 [Alteromonas sp.]|nr:hypothetical protein [Alteromonas sp.]
MKKITLTLLSFVLGITSLCSQNFELTVFASGITQPTHLVNAGDERLFVAEKTGAIRVINADGTVNTTPFLDLSGQITTNSERGLLGIAFHPDYANNGYFYVNYSDLNGDNQISRFSVSTADPDIADPTSELPLLDITQTFSNHNGGCLAFGPDGYLYISSGDGGEQGDPNNLAQNTELLLGKILRIDVDNPSGGNNYGIPADNPFAGDPSNAQEIWAYGLRNPWKISFDRDTGDFWVADVGQNSVEEVNQVASTEAGINYGWHCFEGSDPYDSSGCPPQNELTFPVAEYSHTEGFSITGGYVYRGILSNTINNLYFFGDFGTGIIGTVDATTSEMNIYDNFSGNWSTFGEDNQGELYVASYGGTIYKITGFIIGTEDFNQENVTLYPNPADDVLTINSSLQNLQRVALFDINGKKVKEINASNRQEVELSVAQLNPGLYMVKITSEKGQQHIEKLIVK